MDRPWRQYFGRKNQNQQVAPHKTMTEKTNDDIHSTFCNPNVLQYHVKKIAEIGSMHKRMNLIQGLFSSNRSLCLFLFFFEASIYLYVA